MEDTSKVMIVRNVPESIRRDFKSLCAKEGKSMQEKIIELMKKFIENEGRTLWKKQWKKLSKMR